MYMYMYISLLCCMCNRTCMHVHMHQYVHTWMLSHNSLYMYVFMYTYVYIYTYIYIYIFIYERCAHTAPVTWIFVNFHRKSAGRCGSFVLSWRVLMLSLLSETCQLFVVHPGIHRTNSVIIPAQLSRRLSYEVATGGVYPANSWARSWILLLVVYLCFGFGVWSMQWEIWKPLGRFFVLVVGTIVAFGG